MNRNTVLTRVAIAVAFLGGLAPAGAQTAPAVTPTSPATDETVTLNPFHVNAADDTGYRATNTLDGSRLNTALKDTPGAISIFTRDLLDDLGVTDVMDLLRYDVSAEESFGDDTFGGPGGEYGKAGDIRRRARARRRKRGARFCSLHEPWAANEWQPPVRTLITRREPRER